MDFKQGQIQDVTINKLNKHTDPRGWLIELIRQDEIEASCMPVMCYVSLTKPGVSRGPHAHKEQTDIFAFVGPSNFKIVLWDIRPDSPTYLRKMELSGGEDDPCMLIIPPGVVHGYKNIGTRDGHVINLPNRLYKGNKKQDPVDEIRYEDDQNSGFII